MKNFLEHADSIFIEDLTVLCMIGIYPDERLKVQPVLVNLELETSFDAAAATGDIDLTLDYQLLRDDIERILIDGRFHLLEQAGQAIMTHIGGLKSEIRNASLRLTKPEALGGDVRAGICMRREFGSRS